MTSTPNDPYQAPQDHQYQAPEDGEWLTEPPPRQGAGTRVAGMVLTLFGALVILARCAGTASGTIQPPADRIEAITTVVLNVLLGIVPLVAGPMLLSRHGRQMRRWRDAEIAAEDARAATQRHLPGGH